MTERWIDACAADAVEPEDVIRFDHDEKTYAIYRSPENEYFATMGSAPMSRSIWPTAW